MRRVLEHLPQLDAPSLPWAVTVEHGRRQPVGFELLPLTLRRARAHRRRDKYQGPFLVGDLGLSLHILFRQFLNTTDFRDRYRRGRRRRLSVITITNTSPGTGMVNDEWDGGQDGKGVGWKRAGCGLAAAFIHRV